MQSREPHTFFLIAFGKVVQAISALTIAGTAALREWPAVIVILRCL